MIENIMEIVLITYNRATYLENTLKQLLKSPFANCKITILDNCSPDETPNVCNKYQDLFPNMTVRRHKMNIGGNPNILRAVETSTSKYTWILGDNDDYDFTDCDDVIKAVLSEKYDLVYVCSPMFPSIKKDSSNKTLNEILDENNNIEHSNKTSTREIYAKELVEVMKGNYFMDLAFISGYIYRTDIYSTDEMIKGYDNVPNFFPHFVLINKSVEDNFFIYKSKKDVIIQRENPQHDAYTYNYTKFYDGWLNSGLMIKDKRIRKIFYKNLDNHILPTNNFIIVMMVAIMVDKATGQKTLKNNLFSLIAVNYKLTCWIEGFLISLILLITYLVPRVVYSTLYKPVLNKVQNN